MTILPASSAQFLPDRLAFPDHPLTWSEWDSIGDTLSAMSKSLLWWIGDWVIYGEAIFGEQSWQSITPEQFPDSTVRGAVWLARIFPPPARTWQLPVSTYQTAARFAPEIRRAILNRAEKEHLSRDQVRDLARIVRHETPEVAMEQVEEIKDLLIIHPPYRLDVSAGALRLSHRKGYVVFADDVAAREMLGALLYDAEQVD